MQFGSSFSHRHLEYLDCNPRKALINFKELNLHWIRLACYWDEIESKKKIYDFSKIEPLVKYCDKNKINIVMTVGMKAPRWPEYHIPNWVENHLTSNTRKINSNELLDLASDFIFHCVDYFKTVKSIKVWQIENEPLDPSGENRVSIDSKFLEKEIQVVRKIDPNRNILINLWGNEAWIRGHYKKATNLSDIVGLDLYTKHELKIGNKFIKYLGPIDPKMKTRKIAKYIVDNNRLFWITELQSEPWEPNLELFESSNPPSFTLDKFTSNVEYAISLKPGLIFFWGFEYWYWRLIKKNDNRYWNVARQIINDHSTD